MIHFRPFTTAWCKLLPALSLYYLLLAVSVATAQPSGTAADRLAGSNPDDNTQLESMTVTAQFREQTSVEVPISVTAYDQQFLDDIGVNQLDTLSSFVPGLLVQEQSVNNPGFVIRGITSDNGASNIEPRVSVYQNGVSIARSRGSFVELYDLERVEILKGPQGTLFGRSAQIGAVHIISARPEYLFESDAKLSVGNFSAREADAMVNLPLVQEQLALRVAATYRERDGFIDNLLGGDLNGVDTVALRGSLRADFSDNVRLDLIANYSDDSPPGTSFKSGVLPALGGDTDPFSPAALNSFGGLIDGKPLGIDREIWDLTAIVDVQLTPRLSLVSTTAYREFDSLEVFDPDGSAFDLFIFAEDAQSEQFSSDLRLNFTDGDRLSAFVGGGVFAEEGSQRVPLGLDASLVGALFNSVAAQGAVVNGEAPLLGSVPLTQAFLSGDPALVNQALAAAQTPVGLFQQEQFTNFSDNFSWDLFADVSYALTDRWTASAGGRFTRDNKETLFSSGVEVDNPFVPALLVPEIDGIISSDDDPDIGNNFDGFSWRFVNQFALTEQHNVYASYARGRRPEVIQDVVGDVDPTLSVPVNFVIVPEETVDSFEVGFKGLFMDQRLQFDVAAFYYDYENFQTSITVDAGPGQPPQFQLVNAGSADTAGVETQLLLQLGGGLSAFANYAYNRSRFDQTDSDGNLQVFAGNRFRLSPDHTASAGLRLERAFAGGSWFIAPNITYQSKVFFEDENQTAFRVFDPATGATVFTVPSISEDDYALVNIRGGVSLLQGRLLVEGFASNLFDKDYLIDAGNTGGGFGIPTFIAGAPRFYGAGVTFIY